MGTILVLLAIWGAVAPFLFGATLLGAYRLGREDCGEKLKPVLPRQKKTEPVGLNEDEQLLKWADSYEG